MSGRMRWRPAAAAWRCAAARRLSTTSGLGKANLANPRKLGVHPLKWHPAAVLYSLWFSSLLMAVPLAADEPQRIILWPDGAPGALGTEEADIPTLTVYRPADEKHNGSALLVCPGGGYRHLAVDHEGRQIAEWANRMGTTAFVLRYRLGPRYRHPAPLDDASQAMRWIRHQAETWRIDPRRVAVIGFSAGGHLASTLSTHYEPGDPAADDPLRRQSTRPDLAILCYPVITLSGPAAHAGSRRNLLGDDPPAELIAALSNERQVNAQTPPTFLFHTVSDAVVPVENSLLYFQSLRAAGVPAEMHLYERGRHGVGLAQSDPALAGWPEQCRQWLALHGFFKPNNER